MGRLEKDTADRVKMGLQLGLGQEQIAAELGVGQSTVSAYHSAIKAGENFVPPEGYIRARKRIRWMREVGLDQEEAEKLVQAVDELRHVEVTPSKDSDNLSIHEIASVLNLAHRLYDEKADKHEVAVQLSELAEKYDQHSTSIESNSTTREVQSARPRSMSEVAPDLDEETQRYRTMSEAVRDKGKMLS